MSNIIRLGPWVRSKLSSWLWGGIIPARVTTIHLLENIYTGILLGRKIEDMMACILILCESIIPTLFDYPHLRDNLYIGLLLRTKEVSIDLPLCHQPILD